MGGGGGGVASFWAVLARAWTGGGFVQGVSTAPDKKREVVHAGCVYWDSGWAHGAGLIGEKPANSAAVLFPHH